MLKKAIVNYTRTPISRTELTVGVAYDTDLERPRDVLLTACQEAAGVEVQPSPEAWVQEFADSAILIAVRYWQAADIARRWRVRNAVAISIKRVLDAAGMTIPFPQRTLWLGHGDVRLAVDVRKRPPESAEPAIAPSVARPMGRTR